MNSENTCVFEDAPSLPNWLQQKVPWSRKALRVGGIRVHFIDEGEGKPVLLVHGNPTWSFLWRKVIERLLPKGVRVIAPDLVGFGLSDKPTRIAAHSLEMHVSVMTDLVRALEVDGLTLVGQDWGGPIAAGIGARLSDRIHGLVFSNTAVIRPARPFRPKAFHRFSHLPLISDFVFRGLNFPFFILDRVQNNQRSIGKFEKRAYCWPLRHFADRAAPLALARMVPNAEEHSSTALLDVIGGWVESFEGPTALVWGTKDPILGRGLARHQKAFPRAMVIETEAGHFLQEEVPDVLSKAILEVAR